MSGTAGRIVVGVDGSESSTAALHWALDEAELRGVDVQAVMAWQHPVVYNNPPTMMAVSSTVVAFDDLAAAAAGEVARIAAEAGQNRTASITAESVEGHPAEALISIAADAALLVVGSRGHGGFVGALLGSVSQHVVAHAECPVVVVRDRSHGDAERMRHDTY
jgi:nucleotide-binding universal stress UspA family protein